LEISNKEKYLYREDSSIRLPKGREKRLLQPPGNFRMKRIELNKEK